MAELFSLPRMARRLGVTQNWLRRESDAGRIPCLRADRRYLFSVEDVVAALAARATTSRATKPEAKGAVHE